MTYYQFSTLRAGKLSPFSNKCCALFSETLQHGELFVSFVNGEPEAFKALRCPKCGAIFVEHYWATSDSSIENAHFLVETTENK